MNGYKWIVTFPIILVLLFSPILGSPVGIVSAQAGTVCSSSSPTSGAYAVMICYSNPAANSTLTGDVPITVLVTVGGTNPGVQKVIFYLNGSYLITDYQSSYTFTLPTTKFVDGAYSLSIKAVMRDGFNTGQTVLPVSFSNGISTTPVNTNQFQPTTGRAPSVNEPFVVTAAGDGASGEANAIAVTNLISAINPNLFLYLGDVYDKGTSVEFYNWYGIQGSNFGTFRNLTNPTIGNHEYENGVAPGYFDYWDNVPNYYSFDAGGWHFINLNSNVTHIGVGPQSPQYQWLQQDLAAHDQVCTIVYYHHPLFNIGPAGTTTEMSSIWSLLAQHKVEIVLNGHDHTYQRWVPLNGNGQPSPDGITEFVVGASGHGIQTINSSDSRVAYATDSNPEAFGAINFVLNSAGASFYYKNTSGNILDSGTIPCLHVGTDSEPPSSPTNLSGFAPNSYQVSLSWSAASDNLGVSGYSIIRDGLTIGTVAGSTLSYTDSTAAAATSYTYAVDAFDAAGNHSPQSLPVTVMTTAVPPEVTYYPEADTYVSASSAGSNYGKSTSLRLDNSPDIHGYLRFNLQGITGAPLTKARLLLYANASSTLGIQTRNVANTTWGELTTNYNNAPSLGSVISSSGTFSGNGWVAIDVTPYITGDGIYTVGISTPSSSAISFGSRESGANSPYLLLEFQSEGPDVQAPSVPTVLTASASTPTQIDLTWSESTDNVGVTGYTLFRDGSPISTHPSGTLSFSDTDVLPETTYTYAVDAFDQAGNHSAISPGFPATTPPNNLSSLTFTPEADTYVTASNPNTNYGSSTTLRMDASPDLHSYLRFSVQGVSGRIINQARLLIYTNSTSSIGIRAYSVANSTWGEKSTTFNNAPPFGSLLASSGAITKNTWVTLDLTGSVTGDGLFSFGVNTPSNTAISLASRETGGNSPQLILDLGGLAGPDTTPPSVPGNLTAVSNSPSQVDLAWEASSDNLAVVGYTIFRDGFSLGTMPASSLSFTDSLVTPSTVYEYSLDAFDEAGNHSSPTPPLSITTAAPPDTEPPVMPSAPAATAISSNQVNLTWEPATDNVGIQGYTIYRDGVLLTSVSASSLSYSDITVLPTTTYEYSLDAFDLAGNHSQITPSSPVTTPEFVDTQAPSIPAGLNGVAISTTQIDLSWTASSDNVGVTGYSIYRDGNFLASVDGAILTISDTSLSPETAYSYTVDASDLSGNVSVQSDTLNVTTQSPPPTSLTFTPEADTYVNASNPGSNYGSTTTLRLDASPDLHSYIRFNVQGTDGRPVVQARLLVYTNNNSTPGIQVFNVDDNGWGEKSTNYGNAPVLGGVLTSSGGIYAGTWITLDITSYISSDGVYSFGLTTPSSTAMSLASRETGANSPQLILDF